MAPIEVDSPKDFDKVFSSLEPFIVHYYTTWCRGCSQVKPYIEQAGNEKEYADLPIYKVDCDKLGKLTKRKGIRSYPTTIAYRAGQAFDSHEHYLAYKPLKKWIDSIRRACRIADSITDLSDSINAPVAPLDERSSCVTMLQNEEDFRDFIHIRKHAVVLVAWNDPVSRMISLVVDHLAAFPSFGQLKFGRVDGQQKAVVNKLRTPSIPAVVYLRNGAVFGLNCVLRVQNAAEVHAFLKDFIAASKIADTAEEFDAPLQKVSLAPNTEITNVGWLRETDFESLEFSANGCVENFQATNKYPSIVEITYSELFTELTSSLGSVVVHCYSNDVYSTAMSLIHERVAVLSGYDETIHFCKIDITRQQEVLKEMDIEVNSQETLILVERKVVARINYAGMNEFKSWLMTHVNGQQVDVPKNSSVVPYNDNALRSSSGPRGNIPASALTRNVLPRAGESTDSVVSRMSVASSLVETLVPCKGGKAVKNKPGVWDKLMGSRYWKDQEARCLFTPTPEDEGIQIADVTHHGSRVSITMSHPPSPQKGDLQVIFRMGFSRNVNANARFTSATFCVVFQRYVNDTQCAPLNIRDLSPRDEKGEETEVAVGAEQAVSAGVQAGMQGAALQGSVGTRSNKAYTLKTCSRVTGLGLGTPTATWTFEEDPGEAGKKGLDPHYPLHVHFSRQNTEVISIKFYAETVLMEGSKKKVLTIGNEKELFSRELVLSD